MWRILFGKQNTCIHNVCLYMIYVHMAYVCVFIHLYAYVCTSMVKISLASAENICMLYWRHGTKYNILSFQVFQFNRAIVQFESLARFHAAWCCNIHNHQMQSILYSVNSLISSGFELCDLSIRVTSQQNTPSRHLKYKYGCLTSYWEQIL